MNRLGFRHDNLRAHAARAAREREPASSTPSTRTSRPPTIPSRRSSTSSARASSAALARRRRRSAAARATATRANSAALLRDSRVWYDRVRPGLLLYGIVPPPLASTIAADAGDVARQPRRRGEGHAARRGRRLRRAGSRAERPTTIAIVPAGYADGLDLRLAGRGAVLIRGRRAPIVGSVCMDMLMVDVTGLDVSPGDEVVIIGSQGDDRDRRPRDGRDDRHDSVGDRLPHRQPDRTRLRVTVNWSSA